MAERDRAQGVRSYRELRVWQQGMSLVEQVYQLTKQFPAQEVSGLTSQMRRAAVSVPSNIAEGHVRESTREYLKHLSIAQASLAELETQVEIAGRLGFISAQPVNDILENAASPGRQLFALRNALQHRMHLTEKQ
jgi:four helix bundle protein